MKSSRRVQRKRRLILSLLGLTFVAVFIFTAHLFLLYRHLTASFTETQTWIPSRIYSDVARIFPRQSRQEVEDRLSARSYAYHKNGRVLEVTIPPLNYPQSLLPSSESHREGDFLLEFSSDSKKGALQSITQGETQIRELFLEPELVATLAQKESDKILTYLKFEEIPASVWKAIISVEDQHYLDHLGLDPKGILRAFWINLKTFSFSQGGSTITQQLVKNLLTRRGKNLFKKLNELLLSILLELRFDKEQILERYLNEVYLGQIGSLEIHGIEEGARYFFGKTVSGLNLAEIALIAGLIRGPHYYSPYRYPKRAQERQFWVLQKMLETDQIALAEWKEAKKLPLRLAPFQGFLTKAPFFVDYVKAELAGRLKETFPVDDLLKAGLQIYTTLDPWANQQAQLALASHLKNPDLEGALACVEHETGSLRALVGGKDYSLSQFNRILNMRRQVGSTFKPIVYLAAFLKGKDASGTPYSASYPLEDAPYRFIFDRGRQTWTPKNYDRKYAGWMSLKEALAKSINSVAARLSYDVGLDRVIETARLLGIQSGLSKLPSLALGTAELTPIELLHAYSVFANRGVDQEFQAIREITSSSGETYYRHSSQSSLQAHSQTTSESASPVKAVLPTVAVDLLNEMLKEDFESGTARSARALGFTDQAGGKTGTTNSYRDAWFVGFTSTLTSVVWVGTDRQVTDKPPILTGTRNALPIWVSFMKTQPSSPPFPESPLLKQVSIDRHTGLKASSSCESAIPEKVALEQKFSKESCESGWPKSSPLTLPMD